MTPDHQPTIADYPRVVREPVRFRDLDPLGHVNNAVFSTFLETARIDVLWDADAPLHAPDGTFVIARIELDYRGEIRWPGSVTTGTRVTRVGRSSITFTQATFQDDRLVAEALSVIVHIDTTTRRSTALPEASVERLRALM